MSASHIVVGRSDTSPTRPSHTPGVRMGNTPHSNGDPGVRRLPDGRVLVTGRRSTGINARNREPIDPQSPRLTPA